MPYIPGKEVRPIQKCLLCIEKTQKPQKCRSGNASASMSAWVKSLFLLPSPSQQTTRNPAPLLCSHMPYLSLCSKTPTNILNPHHVSHWLALERFPWPYHQTAFYLSQLQFLFRVESHLIQCCGLFIPSLNWPKIHSVPWLHPEWDPARKCIAFQCFLFFFNVHRYFVCMCIYTMCTEVRRVCQIPW